MKKLCKTYLISVVFWVFGILPNTALASDQGELLDYIVAVVNSDVITHNELERRVDLIRSQLQDTVTALPDDQQLYAQVLDYIINEKLQLQLAQDFGITVDDTALNQAIISVAEQNNLSLPEFQAVLAEDGYSYQQFREDFRNEMTIGRLQQQQLANQALVNEREIDNAILQSDNATNEDTQYRLGHILVALPEDPTTEDVLAAQAKIDELQSELANGADFAQLAVTYSNSMQALQGGDLGWRRLEEIPTIFADDVPFLDINEVSGPYQNAGGLHLISLLEKNAFEVEQHNVEQTKARHILIQPNEVVTSDDARLRLEDLRESITTEPALEARVALFAELAQANSDDINSLSSGGDLNWVSPGTLEPSFEIEMERLAPGEVSAPFETPFGWHIVLVEERRTIDNTEEFRRNQVRERIQNRNYQENMERWLRELRDEAHVEIRDASLMN